MCGATAPMEPAKSSGLQLMPAVTDFFLFVARMSGLWRRGKQHMTWHKNRMDGVLNDGTWWASSRA